MHEYWIENWIFLTWPRPDLFKNKFWWLNRVKWPSLSISKCKMTQNTRITWHACDIYFLATMYDLTYGLFRYDICTHAVFFSDIYQLPVWVWALCCPLGGGGGAKNTFFVFARGACLIIIPYVSVSGKTLFKIRSDAFSVGLQNLSIMCQGPDLGSNLKIDFWGHQYIFRRALTREIQWRF